MTDTPAFPLPLDDERRQHLADCYAAEALGGCFWLAMAAIHRGRLNG